ncbi:MAG: sulfotransferase, partial [Myxococcota bacterium]
MASDNLAFVLCTPRSGSTLLQRMLGAHSQIYTHPEPHLLTPLYYAGYYATVDAAPYDHINAGAALRELCDELPRGEEDYLDALRAYARTLYDRVREPTGLPIFLDKTPAYGLVASFVAKLFPEARFVVLTRHPMAIWHSQKAAERRDVGLDQGIGVQGRSVVAAEKAVGLRVPDRHRKRVLSCSLGIR